MEIPYPKTFCFCTTLKTGCIINGAILLVFSLLQFVYILAEIIRFVDEHVWMEPEFFSLGVAQMLTIVYAVGMQATFSIFLIYAACKEQGSFIMSTIIFEGVLFFIFTLSVIANLVRRHHLIYENAIASVVFFKVVLTAYGHYMSIPKKDLDDNRSLESES